MIINILMKRGLLNMFLTLYQKRKHPPREKRNGCPLGGYLKVSPSISQVVLQRHTKVCLNGLLL